MKDNESLGNVAFGDGGGYPPTILPTACVSSQLDLMPVWDAQIVHSRLLEAFETEAAMRDPAPGPRLKLSGIWRETVRERVDVDCEPSPARPGVSREALARMEEAQGWCEWLAPADRRLMGAVMQGLVRGWSRPDWVAVRRKLGDERTTDAMRNAFRRSLLAISKRLSDG